MEGMEPGRSNPERRTNCPSGLFSDGVGMSGGGVTIGFKLGVNSVGVGIAMLSEGIVSALVVRVIGPVSMGGVCWGRAMNVLVTLRLSGCLEPGVGGTKGVATVKGLRRVNKGFSFSSSSIIGWGFVLLSRLALFLGRSWSISCACSAGGSETRCESRRGSDGD